MKRPHISDPKALILAPAALILLAYFLMSNGVSCNQFDMFRDDIKTHQQVLDEDVIIKEIEARVQREAAERDKWLEQWGVGIELQRSGGFSPANPLPDEDDDLSLTNPQPEVEPRF